jgi:hypothetical protein
MTQRAARKCWFAKNLTGYSKELIEMTKPQNFVDVLLGFVKDNCTPGFFAALPSQKEHTESGAIDEAHFRQVERQSRTARAEQAINGSAKLLVRLKIKSPSKRNCGANGSFRDVNFHNFTPC